jgi:hypothetical protein
MRHGTQAYQQKTRKLAPCPEGEFSSLNSQLLPAARRVPKLAHHILLGLCFPFDLRELAPGGRRKLNGNLKLRFHRARRARSVFLVDGEGHFLLELPLDVPLLRER